jgi:hypothetical protein
MAHNEVNASLGKPRFDCARLDERWSKLECGDEDDGGVGGCTLHGRRVKVLGAK